MKIRHLILGMLLCLSSVSSAENEVFASFMHAISSTVLQSKFTLSVQDVNATPITYSGTLAMVGDRFMATSSLLEVAYDGKTLYIYQNGELTLTTLTADQLLQMNPMHMAQYYAAKCVISSRTNKDGTVLVSAKPNDNAEEIRRLSVKLQPCTMPDGSASYVPLSIELHTTQTDISLRLRNPAYTKDEPDFVLSKPGAYVNDLR